ncbi:MAG: tRNA uridine-5-carboxymethylaminomethyl(34) synthesis enzyme MnmG [Planctomycetes bacterium]|nr:tRNA uridine-5-carboxymethylaminomethyl(34) synthesis enzyme MnmG [Planctomycetota bacterium]
MVFSFNLFQDSSTFMGQVPVPNPQVIVIGGGHAGCEAALAAARLGARTLLLSMDPDRIGHVSCNPAIGGVGKGQLVREIDALGGMMALAADHNALQFKMLNSSKGPAVRSPRAQVDRWRYGQWVKTYLENQPNLSLRLDQAVGIVVEKGRIRGVQTFFGQTIPCQAVVVCSGTFAGGILHCGEIRWSGGRAGEPAATQLSQSLKANGLDLFRLRTGTCPRIDARTVDFARLRPEPGDRPPTYFSYETEDVPCPDIPCYATWTTEETFRIVHDNLHLSPLHTGAVAGESPRYCPNFETKVARFPEKKSHHLFVEPEGGASTECYLNGLYLSLPPAIQEQVVRSIPGLENAAIVRFGYSVEYDAVRSTQLRETLETKAIAGLFTAGQVNGTSGYEEAAAQGLIAGANAGLMALGREPFRLGRDQAYIGVLVDDLTIRGTDEPYRLFTSRAEYRLLLRQDNADLRLTRLGAAVGLVSADRRERTERLAGEIETGRAILRRIRDGAGDTLETVLRRPETTLEDLTRDQPELAALSPRAKEQLAIDATYEGYIARHLRQIEQLEKHRRVRLPSGFDYGAVNGLSREASEKLSRFRPENLDQAMRISGVSPADAALLLVWLERHRSEPVADPPVGVC